MQTLNTLTSRGIPKAQAVQPIKNVDDIEKIKQYLLGKKNKRDYTLFIVGINVGLRAGDLLKLRIGEVVENDGTITNEVKIVEGKTKKFRVFTLNRSAKNAIKLYLKSLPSYNISDYLFRSQKGGGPITVTYAHSIVKGTLRALNIKGNYGTHSLRKTFAYHTYMNNAKDNPLILPTLQRILNHISQSITLRYIGIDDQVITDLYMGLNL